MFFLQFFFHISSQIVGISAVLNSSHCVNYLASSSISRTELIAYSDSTRTYGNVDCLDGDVVLIGNYLNLGESFYPL